MPCAGWSTDDVTSQTPASSPSVRDAAEVAAMLAPGSVSATAPSLYTVVPLTRTLAAPVIGTTAEPVVPAGVCNVSS